MWLYGLEMDFAAFFRFFLHYTRYDKVSKFFFQTLFNVIFCLKPFTLWECFFLNWYPSRKSQRHRWWLFHSVGLASIEIFVSSALSKSNSDDREESLVNICITSIAYSGTFEQISRVEKKTICIRKTSEWLSRNNIMTFRGKKVLGNLPRCTGESLSMR